MKREETVIAVNGIRINCARQGRGPLVILIHGFPETSYCWRKVAPILAQSCTVATPDLRGYGLSDKPVDGYDKKTMAVDIRDLATQLGFERIALIAGHDRGARVAHRCGLDFPDVVERLVMLDLLPSREALRDFDLARAKLYWHWFFHLVPDLPEQFIGSNLEAYINMFFKNAYVRTAVDEAVPEYVKSLSRSGALRAALSDYRSTFGKDLDDDDATFSSGERLKMPTLLLWGEKGLNTDRTKMLKIWSKYANQVDAASVPDCGYYMPEEQPEALAHHILEFLAKPAHPNT